jgi:protein-L-isoaspartate(D-aspartate) O-methyltransferase
MQSSKELRFVPQYDRQKKEMVDLLKERGILDSHVLAAFGKVDRQLFVPDALRSRAFDDCALPIGCSQTISQPYTVAFMTQCLSVKKGDKVLEVGTGSGYQAAILSEMGARVFSIERHAELLYAARKVLDKLKYDVATKVGDGTVGWVEFAPFDGIVVTAGAPEIPEPLKKQLADGGRLVIPIGDFDMQQMNIVVRHGDEYEVKEVFGFRFVPLIGKKGWG